MKLRHAVMGAVVALALAGCERRADDGVSGLDPKQREFLDKANIQVADVERVGRGCVGPGNASRPGSDFSQAERLEILSCINREAVRLMTPRLPIQIDSVTSLTAVVASGPLLTYHSRVAIDASQVTPAQMQLVHQAARANACGQPAMRQALSLGGSYAYVWTDRNGRSLPPLRIDSC
ncbi:MAG TPA: hypothetical protein VEX35_07300 [Allosphingosinicella sp.]|nr:hypothetical protein [Allosphingosinicella sp.]